MSAGIVGVGTSSFGKQPTESYETLVRQAVLEAVGQELHAAVDAVYLGTVWGPPGVAQRVLAPLGLAGRPVVTVENACASGTTAFAEAVAAVESGRYRSVLAVGVEMMTSQVSGAIEPEPMDIEGRAGLALPALYAMMAQRYQAKFGISKESLALVSVKNHRHGRHNERAQHREEVGLTQVLESRPVAEPLTLLQCCSIADGAAAVVVTSRPDRRRHVGIRSVELRSGGLWDHRSPHAWGYDLIQGTAAAALESAGAAIDDVDVIECHDAFTIGEVIATEAIGMAPEGQGVELVERGHTWVGGPQPVNPSGGLLSRGHPLGATGIAQIAEVVWQLEGRAGKRQVDDPRIGLVETMGGGASGLDGNACVVAILEAPRR